MSGLQCHFCDRSTATGHSMHRINEKGVPGIWACGEHFEQGNWKKDPETMRIVKILEKGSPK